MHALDRPNLRPKALGWIATQGAGALLHPSRLRGHGVDASYGLASLVYIVGFAVLIAVVFRTPLQRAFEGVLPNAAAAILAWALIIALPLLVLAGVIGDLMAAREQAQSRRKH